MIATPADLHPLSAAGVEISKKELLRVYCLWDPWHCGILPFVPQHPSLHVVIEHALKHTAYRLLYLRIENGSGNLNTSIDIPCHKISGGDIHIARAE